MIEKFRGIKSAMKIERIAKRERRAKEAMHEQGQVPETYWSSQGPVRWVYVWSRR